MIDPSTIAHGVASQILGDKASKQLDHWSRGNQPTEYDLLCKIATHLESIDKATSLQETPNVDEPLPLLPYPQEYVTDEYNHQRPHVCILFATSTPARFDIPGIGTIQKAVGPGWVQIDTPGNTRISTTDSQTHYVIVSYRDNPIGASSL